MLYVDCGCEREFDTCEKCNGFGRVEAPKEQIVFVSVYKVTRHFGGHEEGGWYYNWYELVETIPTQNKYSDIIFEELEKKYQSMKHGDIYSVLGGVDVEIYVEEKIGENQTTERPIYE